MNKIFTEQTHIGFEEMIDEITNLDEKNKYSGFKKIEEYLNQFVSDGDNQLSEAYYILGEAVQDVESEENWTELLMKKAIDFAQTADFIDDNSFMFEIYNVEENYYEDKKIELENTSSEIVERNKIVDTDIGPEEMVLEKLENSTCKKLIDELNSEIGQIDESIIIKKFELILSKCTLPMELWFTGVWIYNILENIDWSFQLFEKAINDVETFQELAVLSQYLFTIFKYENDDPRKKLALDTAKRALNFKVEKSEKSNFIENMIYEFLTEEEAKELYKGLKKL